MKNSTIILSILLVSVWLTSCSFPTPLSLKHLTKDMTTEDILKDATPAQKFTIASTASPNAKIIFFVFDYPTGRFFGDYFLAFKDNQLLFWGFPHEFARSSDTYINELGKAALKEHLRLK